MKTPNEVYKKPIQDIKGRVGNDLPIPENTTPFQNKDIVEKNPEEFLDVCLYRPSTETLAKLDINFINKMNNNVRVLLKKTTIDDSNFPEAKKWLSDSAVNYECYYYILADF